MFAAASSEGDKTHKNYVLKLSLCSDGKKVLLVIVKIIYGPFCVHSILIRCNCRALAGGWAGHLRSAV